ncbi:Dihydrolipoyl dehydrogenase [Zhongshania aliphaticivorans]|uniref:Dihydrolipoyl dehydrogenase n=1 Tax=Zhongshania aliphaticivorans TaxID=1470434 RepID=A0A5S9NS83_9GAMM|nr:FAD-dependent oxidoreductase [Zhongshania aliphaticivorans]CAA0093391.1 Dihydrolipoyl dehydrogenase [Zhongshania aliphaticivorans]CAA0111269.1 Dihydrolipoyl dehydrogenase [Zhongshania aliphaticivorans]
MKNVVIIGGGHGGIDLAKKLDSVAIVTMIDGKSCFVHTPAAIRALAEPALLDQLIMPYDNLLARGKVVQGWVANIKEDGVELTDGRELPADIIVVATGSTYAKPFKHSDAGLDDYRAAQKEVAASLNAANTVVIVGAGPVGTELAGEIACKYPSKAIHLVTNEDHLFPTYTPNLAKKLEADLLKLGVQLHTGKAVEDLQSLSEPYAGKVTLEGGQQIEADLVFPVVGSRPQSELLAKVDGVKLATDGRVEHDGWMRPSQLRPNLFAVGDVLASGDAMTIVALARQVPWLEKTIKVVLAGKSVTSLKPYTPWPVAPILVPLGSNFGATALPFGKQGMAVGHFFTSKIKGKELFIPKYRKQLRLK